MDTGRFEVLRGVDALQALAPQWEGLWGLCDPLPPMLEYEWVRTWWRLHRRQGELFVVVVYDSDRPIGLAPLYIRARGNRVARSLRAVMFLGTGEPELEEVCGENTGWLCAPEHSPCVTRAVAGALTRYAAAWDRIDLRTMGPDTRPAEQLQRHVRPLLLESEVHRATSCGVVVAPFDEYVARVASRSRRARFRKLMRRANDAGIRRVRAETADQALAMFDQLVLLHQRYWHQRGEPGACSSRVFRQFHRRLIQRRFETGRLWLFGLQMPSGDWAALHYDIEAGDTLYYYLSGIDYDAAATLSPGNLILLHAIDLAADKGLRRLDLMAGDAEFKRQLATDYTDTASLEGVARGVVPRVWLTLRRVKRQLHRVAS